MLRLLLMALLLAPAPALAQVVSERPDQAAIVVYPELDEGFGLVMVTERRTVDLPAGRTRISFRNVADGIVAQTVAIQGLPQGVLEQNFDYQLLTPGALIQQSEGRQVEVVRTNPATGQTKAERARVVSADEGAVLDFGGRLEALKCSALPERLVFDDLPPGYADRPTLSVDAVLPAAGRYAVTLSYLATGMDWQANYVARVAPDRQTLSLLSWITLRNSSAAQFPDAPVQVLAGRLEREVEQTVGVSVEPVSFDPNCWRIDSGRWDRGRKLVDMSDWGDTEVEEIIVTAVRIRGTAEDSALPVEVIGRDALRENLGDYKLYSLPERTTVAAYQTKQVRMFERRDVPFAWIHRVQLSTFWDGWSDEPKPAALVIELRNEVQAGLGLPLPAGEVAVFEPGPDGSQRLVGMNGIENTAEGLPFELVLGEAPLVHVQTRVVPGWDRHGRAKVKVEVTVTNAGAARATVQVRESVAGGRGGNLRVLSSSVRHEMKYGPPQWTVQVPGGGRTVFTYTIELKG